MPIRLLAALIEVLCVFCVVHLSFRGFRQFTPLGQAEVQAGLNFSPGLVMALATFLLLLALGRKAQAWGIRFSAGRESASLALLSLLLISLVGAALYAFGLESSPANLNAKAGMLYAALGLGISTAVFWSVQRNPSLLAVFSPALAGVVCAGILLAPLVVCFATQAEFSAVLLAVIWRFACAGFGEEFFFRGYIQGRLNESFGRPWSFFGVRFGWGLIVASLLFALIHVLNPFDPFSATGSLAWGHGLATLSLTYGLLREKTGSILAPALLHGLLDVLILVPRLLSA